MKTFANVDFIREITEAKCSSFSSQILAENCLGISTDTRTLKRGEIFFSFRGRKF